MALAVLSASPAAGQEDKPSALERIGLRLEVAAGVLHDDNIIQLSDQDLRRFEANPDSTRFRIASTDDWVLHPEFNVRWSHEIFPHRTTRIGAGVELFRYDQNAIKNWNEYHFVLYQELTGSRKHLLSLRAGLDWISDFYVRELTDDAASFAAGVRIRESARFDQSEASGSLSWELVDDHLTMSLGYSHARRDYETFFPERDGTRDESALEARARPFKTWRFNLEVGWATGQYAAVGDLPSTPFPDDDISFDLDRRSIRIVLPWISRYPGRFEASFETERREFTTDNVFDLTHYLRTDHRDDTVIRIVQGLAHGMELGFEWRELSNDATFPAEVLPQDDITDFVERRFGVLFGARFR